ncbi:hypothetical protein MUA04_00595 [Enterobacteriaceae bacterium H11S18]|uniref:hypothetical protein n=1 Tax=Dryocola clanedunensis TaxID=2925396 RepID=UPI0022F0C964|nr:hypothetical protein [Dryocola clanedunensis]MCT4708740.1 hypothetical protein [Dryocola clanedunensis]
MQHGQKCETIQVICYNTVYLFNATLPPDWMDLSSLNTKTLFIHSSINDKKSVECFFNLLKKIPQNLFISILYNARLYVIEHIDMALHITVGNTETIRDDADIVIEWKLNILSRIDSALLNKSDLGQASS